MAIKNVIAVFFSATGTTDKIVSRIADCISSRLGAERSTYDFTLPRARTTPLRFSAQDLVVFGTPVYAGRIPNILLKYLDTMEGNGALAIPVAVFGNRNYDDSLVEQRDLLQRKGLHPVAAGAFIGEHSFSTILGGGRPDAQDVQLVEEFAHKAAAKIAALPEGAVPELVHVKGVPYPHAGYYQPRDSQGNPVDLRKVKPKTNDECIDCKICVDVCPMGSVDPENVHLFTGICIKCGACIKKCPVNARYYDDKEYLYHQHELEEEFARRAEPETFL